MAQIPSVADGLLQGTRTGGAAGLAVGSSAWFAWLAGDAARSFSFRSPSGAYIARKERRQRGGVYWVAYRTAAGRQHQPLWLDRGVRSRASSPSTSRWATLGCGILRLVVICLHLPWIHPFRVTCREPRGRYGHRSLRRTERP